jgi:peroxiredoxin
MVMKHWSVLIFALLINTLIFAQAGHQIKVKIEGFAEKNLLLGYYLADKQYVLDTVEANAKGEFIFTGEKPLDPGMYIVVLPPKNDFFQFLVSKDEQKFSINTIVSNPGEHLKFEGSKENTLFYSYVAYLGSLRPQAEKISKDSETADEATKAKLTAQMDALNKQVLDYQNGFVQKNAGTLAAAVVKANINAEPPAAINKLSGEEKQVQLWQWTREHFFDNMPLGDNRLLRTPFYFQRIDYYINKLTVQAPDSIILALDRIYKLMEPAEEAYKFYVIHYLNHYAASKYVGFDAVYVHLAENYYGSGKAKWANEESIKKITEQARKLKPLLIGKTAPDIYLEREGQTKMLSQIQSPWTVLYFWRYDCGHCKESMPSMKKFFDTFKDKGITLVAICVKNQNEQGECKKFIDEQGIGAWYHAFDPTGRYYANYNVETTPQMYILDENKKIISKQVPAEDLNEVMDKIMEMKKKEAMKE